MTDRDLPSWRDTLTRAAIADFVDAAAALPVEERIAVFDNDGTLWCEKPMPVELGFILERLAEMAADDPTLRGRQPWKAAREKDHVWLGGVITRHYQGDDSGVKVALDGIRRAFAGWAVEEYEAAAGAFLREKTQPVYRPMVELLRHLESNGFTNYIASGGDRDFMRTVAQEL
jgi:phosphoglycolate phosphatase-like HAD superfamily hydrolase